MRLFKYYFIILLALDSCNIQGQQNVKMGVVNTTFETFFSTSVPPFLGSSLIWYRDSTVVMSIPRVRFASKNNEPAVRSDTIMHYLFIDLKSKSFYQYGTFTDTAALQKSYWQPDSLYIDGGWNFYYDKNVVMLHKPEQVEDTIISAVNYKRVKFTTLENESRGGYSIGYIRCDRGRSMFSREKNYSDSINCSMDIIESYNKITNNKEVTTSTEFLRDLLNEEEIKVFDTWEGYAKKHPPKEKKLK